MYSKQSAQRSLAAATVAFAPALVTLTSSPAQGAGPGYCQFIGSPQDLNVVSAGGYTAEDGVMNYTGFPGCKVQRAINVGQGVIFGRVGGNGIIAIVQGGQLVFAGTIRRSVTRVPLSGTFEGQTFHRFMIFNVQMAR